MRATDLIHIVDEGINYHGRRANPQYPEEDTPIDDDEFNNIHGSRPATAFRYLDQRGVGFRVLAHSHDNHAAERPLAVVIHPGDMINHYFPSHGTPPDEVELMKQSVRWGNENLQGMRVELASLKKKGYDFVVLHRESSVQFPENSHHDTKKKVWAELQAGAKRGTMVFGDDLIRAGNWMVKNLHIADRPHVYMLGAYSDPNNGCLTTVGMIFKKVLDPSKITVSQYSPVSDDPEEQSKAWRP